MSILKSNHEEIQLPFFQKMFLKDYDGTLGSVITSKHLPVVLNPTFTAHYFYVSGDSMENIITTKHTDGSFAYNGSQTEEAMCNAYLLASEVKSLIMSHNPKQLQELVCFDENKMRFFNSKISRVRKTAAFIINGEIRIAKGLNL